MNTRYRAEFITEMGYLSAPWAEKLAREKFGDKQIDALTRYVRGPRKGLLKGWLMIKRCTRGGWVKTGSYDFAAMQGCGYVESRVGRVIEIKLERAGATLRSGPEVLATWELGDEVTV